MSGAEHLRDEELADSLSRDQQRHVDHCQDCAHRRSASLRVQEAIRDLPRTAPPPAGVLALLDAQASSARPLWRGRRRAALLALAGAAALFAFLALRPGRQAPMKDELAQEIALDHLHYERQTNAAEVFGTRDQIDDYFARTIQRRPRLAALEAATVLGGKRCRIGGEWSALIWLERAGRWLSFFSMPQDAVTSRGCVQSAGVNVCGVSDPLGGSRVLAGNLPDAELLRLLEESME